LLHLARLYVLVSFMNAPCPSERFALTTSALCRAVAAALRHGLMNGAMIVLVWTRVRRAEVAFLALLERVRQGRYRGGIVRRSGGSQDLVEGATEVRSGSVSPGDAPGWRGLPRRFGWLIGLMPFEAAGYSSQLAHLLAEPEMVALLRDVPQAGRILGPLCWMLGIEAGLVRPGVLAVERAPRAEAGPRVRAVRDKMDWGRIPLPRGILARALRDRRLEAARARVVEFRKGDLG
jgi:hypothetical protein